MTDIQKLLFALQDVEYKKFHCRLIPNIDANAVIGIRIPKLRALAKELYGTDEAGKFLRELPHKYYEENNLHAFLIEKIKYYELCVSEVDRFLPFVDNWATCESLSPKALARDKKMLQKDIMRWLASRHTYTVRFGIGMLLKYFLDSDFALEHLEAVANISSDEYYIKMMVAWYFATALAKQYNSAIIFIEKKRLDKWTHNKTIQKAEESYRITAEQKAYLKKLKI